MMALHIDELTVIRDIITHLQHIVEFTAAVLGLLEIFYVIGNKGVVSRYIMRFYNLLNKERITAMPAIAMQLYILIQSSLIIYVNRLLIYRNGISARALFFLYGPVYSASLIYIGDVIGAVFTLLAWAICATLFAVATHALSLEILEHPYKKALVHGATTNMLCFVPATLYVLNSAIYTDLSKAILCLTVLFPFISLFSFTVIFMPFGIGYAMTQLSVSDYLQVHTDRREAIRDGVKVISKQSARLQDARPLRVFFDYR